MTKPISSGSPGVAASKGADNAQASSPNPLQMLKNKVSELTQAVQRLPGAVSKQFSQVPKQAEDLFNRIVQNGISTAQGPAKPGMVTVQHGPVQINVKPLDLGIAKQALPAAMDKAMQAKAADDERAYGAKVREAGHGSLEEWAKAQGYYNSPEHQAWAKAAEARTGGQIPASFWMKFDPFGGTAGNGPDVLPQGKWPGSLSRIAMGHDTDWSLGRYFDVGPLKSLSGANADPTLMGMVGLVPMPGTQFGNAGMYTNPGGHPDWQVIAR
jgi:hypothetical protein